MSLNKPNNVKLSLWMEEDKIYFKTHNNFKFTCIKIYFENEINTLNSSQNQYNGNSILNPFGDYSWSIIPNEEKRLIFFFGNVNQAMSSDTNPLFYISNSKNNIIKVSDVADDNAKSVDESQISINVKI